jgi:hypothetical protein
LQTSDLKYLGLVHVLVLQAAAYLATLYNYAKDSSGPLKPSVDNVEGTVKTVVGPVYQKVEGKPYQLLQYVDSKVILHILLCSVMKWPTQLFVSLL